MVCLSTSPVSLLYSHIAITYSQTETASYSLRQGRSRDEIIGPCSFCVPEMDVVKLIPALARSSPVVF